MAMNERCTTLPTDVKHLYLPLHYCSLFFKWYYHWYYRAKLYKEIPFHFITDEKVYPPVSVR